MSDSIVIVSVARTPMGSFQSDFASLAAWRMMSPGDSGGSAGVAAFAKSAFASSTRGARSFIVAGNKKGRTRGRPSKAEPAAGTLAGSGRLLDQASWAFTFSTMLPKPAGSFTAMSARTLRSMSMLAFFRPAMNLL